MAKKETKNTEKKVNTENMGKITPPMQINGQYIKDFSFEAPGMPFVMLQTKEPPKIDISINVNAARVSKEQNIYTVETELKINAKSGDKVAFICELTYGALVTLMVPEEHVQPLLLVEIPHLTFPYIRSIVANATREAGMMPLTLAPIDFAMLYRNRLAKEAEGNKEKTN